MIEMQRLKYAGEWSQDQEGHWQIGDGCIVICAIITAPGTICNCGCSREIETYAIDIRASIKLVPMPTAPEGFHEFYSGILFAESLEEAKQKTEEKAQLLYDQICAAVVREFTTSILNENEAINKISINNSQGIDPCNN